MFVVAGQTPEAAAPGKAGFDYPAAGQQFNPGLSFGLGYSLQLPAVHRGLTFRFFTRMAPRRQVAPLATHLAQVMQAVEQGPQRVFSLGRVFPHQAQAGTQTAIHRLSYHWNNCASQPYPISPKCSTRPSGCRSAAASLLPAGCGLAAGLPSRGRLRTSCRTRPRIAGISGQIPGVESGGGSRRKNCRLRRCCPLWRGRARRLAPALARGGEQCGAGCAVGAHHEALACCPQLLYHRPVVGQAVGTEVNVLGCLQSNRTMRTEPRIQAISARPE